MNGEYKVMVATSAFGMGKKPSSSLADNYRFSHAHRHRQVRCPFCNFPQSPAFNWRVLSRHRTCRKGWKRSWCCDFLEMERQKFSFSFDFEWCSYLVSLRYAWIFKNLLISTCFTAPFKGKDRRSTIWLVTVSILQIVAWLNLWNTSQPVQFYLNVYFCKSINLWNRWGRGQLQVPIS